MIYSVLNEKTGQYFSVLTDSKERFFELLYSYGVTYADFTLEQLNDIIVLSYSTLQVQFP